jgi:hypothetical protein
MVNFILNFETARGQRRAMFTDPDHLVDERSWRSRYRYPFDKFGSQPQIAASRDIRHRRKKEPGQSAVQSGTGSR